MSIGAESIFAANEVTWNFSGLVRNYQNAQTSAVTTVAPLEFAAVGVVPGAPIDGFLAFDLDAPDSDASPSRRNASGAIVSSKMHVGSLTMLNTPAVNIFVISTVNGPNGLPNKRGLSAAWSSTDSQGIDIGVGSLELFDSDQLIFPNDAMPSTPPSLNALDPFDPTDPTFGTRAVFSANLTSGTWIVVSELTSVSAVPEPSSLVVALLAFAAFSTRSRRK